MKDELTIPVFLCADENYFPHLSAVMASVAQNASAEIHFIVLTSSKSSAEKEKAARACGKNKISFVSIDEYESVFAAFPQKQKHITAAACFRYLIPQLDFPYKKGIYLDCDIIVRGDIRELFEADLSGACVAGVYDYQSPKYAKRLGVEKYFNSGALLMDIEKMRAGGAAQKLISATLEMRDKIKYLDQDVLNIVFAKESAILKPKFGAISPLFRKSLPPAPGQSKKDLSDAVYNPVVVHFTGPDKPWSIPRGIAAHPWAPLYFYYLRKTPYAEKEAEILRGFKYWQRLLWYAKRHLLFFMRPRFWRMRLLYLKNKKLYAK